MGGSRSHFWENHPTIAVLWSSRPYTTAELWSSRPYTIYILSVYTSIKVVSYYDLSVLSMSVMGFQKKVWMGGGWGEVYPSFFWIFGICLTLQSP